MKNPSTSFKRRKFLSFTSTIALGTLFSNPFAVFSAEGNRDLTLLEGKEIAIEPILENLSAGKHIYCTAKGEGTKMERSYKANGYTPAFFEEKKPYSLEGIEGVQKAQLYVRKQDHYLKVLKDKTRTEIKFDYIPLKHVKAIYFA